MQLNQEQRKIITAKPNGHILLKGVAGSGKTTIAVHRLPFLINNYCFAEDDRILLVTYNKTLVNYFNYLYDKVEEENQIGYDNLFRDSEKKIDINTMDQIMYKYFLRYKKESGHKYELYSGNKKYQIMAQCVVEMKKKYPKLNVIDQKNVEFLLDEIDWIKSCNYMEQEEYQNADRLGRMSNNVIEGPQKLMKNSPTREAIFELMLMYTQRMKKLGFIDFKDMGLIALQEAQKGVEQKYTHIMVDESQDLTRVQLQLLKLLYFGKDYSSILFIADTAQSIYSHSWLTKGRSFSSIGFDMTGKSNILSKNYRTTTQIAEAAYSLTENDPNIVEDENYVKPSLIDRQGGYPVCKYFRNAQEEADYLIDEIKNNLLSRYSYKDIVIISKSNNQLKHMKQLMEQAGLPCMIVDRVNRDFKDRSIKFLTMHSIKGLEFKVVFIIGLNEKIIPYYSYNDVEDQGVQESNDRRLLYVGMTRANELLYLSSSAKPSKFLAEINPRYLKLNSGSQFKSFYDVHIEKYEFKENIIDVYSNEEKVRQWLINELKDNYKYPLNLLEVEYKVNNFSQVGSVDLAVCVYKNNRRIPYIFIESKAKGKGLVNSVEQLKSYMSSDHSCQYGIATDGNQMIVLNKDFAIIDDIPAFHTAMLPSSIENYSYIGLNNNREYEISRDGSSLSELYIKDGREYKEYSEETLIELPVYGRIAAGIPISMEEDLVNHFCLPQEWFRGKGKCFFLQIRGDSMQGANIEDGDYVLLEWCQTAMNRDIVAVAIDEDATLKRFMPMGDSVLLVAENAQYEPIHVKREQARILGRAIGVLKKETA